MHRLLIGLTVLILGCHAYPNDDEAPMREVPITDRDIAPPTTGPVEPPATQPTVEAIVLQPDDFGTAVFANGELLLHYEPQSTLVTPEHAFSKPKFPAIDIHCHWSDEIEPAFLIESMNVLGVTRAVNLSGGYGQKLAGMLERYTAFNDRLLIFANIDFNRIDEPDFAQTSVAELRAAAAKGLAGLKIFKSLGLTELDAAGQRIAIDDPRLDPIFNACGELKLPVLIHTADPTAFFTPPDEHNERWMQLKRYPTWSFHGPAFPTREELFAERDRLLDRHKDVTFILAHVGSLADDLAEARATLDRHANAVMDISGREAALGRQPFAARRFFMDYPDRLLFGTDRYPGRPDQPRYAIYYRMLESDDEYFKYYDHDFPPTGEWRIYGLHLPADVLEKVYHLNAERVLDGQ